MSLPKKKAQRVHAKRRLRERYGVDVNRRDMRRMILDIQGQKGEFIGRQSHRLTVWRVQVEEGKTATVIYDSTRKTIVTALPPEATIVVLSPEGVPTTVVV